MLGLRLVVAEAQERDFVGPVLCCPNLLVGLLWPLLIDINCVFLS